MRIENMEGIEDKIEELLSELAHHRWLHEEEYKPIESLWPDWKASDAYWAMINQLDEVMSERRTYGKAFI